MMVKELFYTLQGEGANVGRPAVFCRFAGCNLACEWCDTDFVGGTPFDAEQLAAAAARLWPIGVRHHFVVLTGGEPALQVTPKLIEELHRRRFVVAIETNGTKPLPQSIDWVTFSPKAGAPHVLTRAHEVKIVWPQALDLAAFEGPQWGEHFLQPMDGPRLREHTTQAIDVCLRWPLWRLSIQQHKVLGLP